MRLSRYCVLLVLFLLTLAKSILAQDAGLTYLGIEQGLSNNSITSIYQDHNGFMWFGTFDGLNRYDGYTFKVFRNQLNDSTSLNSSRIVAIEEDKDNNIWVGTKKGISIYNNLKEGFASINYTPCGSGVFQPMRHPVKDIKADKDGNVFIATDGNGLMLAKRNSLAAVPVKIEKTDGCNFSVQAIKIDKELRVWVFLNAKGLYQYDYKSGVLKLANDDINTANCLEEGDSNVLWLGTMGGLYKYDIVRKKYTQFYSEANGSLTANRVINLFANKEELLIATDGGGVNILNTATDSFSSLTAKSDQDAIKSAAVYAVFADREGRKWIGTLRAGINVVDPKKSRFKTIARNPRTANSLINDFVLSFAEEPSGNLWIGTDGGGLSIWDRKNNNFENYVHQNGNAASLSSNFVTNICIDSYGETWVATYAGGINRYDKNSHSFKHYSCANQWGGTAADVWVIFEDSQKNLWAGVLGASLNKLNRETDKFEVFDSKLNDILCLVEDKDGILWGGTFYNLVRIDVANKKIESFNVGTAVRAINIDKSGALWLATEGYGLLEYIPGKTGFKSYSTGQGLKNPSVLTLLDDGKENLWMSSFGGISKFDKRTKHFENFDESDGLQSNQFNYNAAVKLTSGEMFFGGIKGFNVFYPDSIKTFNSTPPVFITGLKINNIPVYRNSPFVKSIETDKIAALRIPYNQASISFDLSALEYSAPEKIEYAYLLEGWDKDWNYAGSQRSGIYSNIREGNYTLKIKTTNSDGVWQKEKTVLEITVLPPWYRSWWAFLLYVTAAVIAIYIYQRYRANQTTMKYEVALAKINAEKERSELERERTERDREKAELEKEKAERKTERVINDREKEISEKRLSFFTSISHEFRTPLTLIINPVRDLIKKHEGEDVTELNIINRSASRLLSLTNQLLLFRKTEDGPESLTLTKFNLADLCKDIYLYFIQEAKTKGIVYEFECVNNDLEMYGDRNKIEIILYNLVSNAFKYTPAEGSINFIISESDAYLNVFVKDNGRGISPEVGDRIFERFYQADGHLKTGFGIGLYLVKQFTNLHRGRISYQSVSGEGTRFTLELLKGKEHFGTQPILDRMPETKLFEQIATPAESGTDLVSTEKSAIPLAPVITSQKVLLVVDDDAEIRKYIAQLFAGPFIIYEAVNGAEGLALTRKMQPDLVISDVMMPEMTGIEMCRLIKEDAALNHIPVILLTAMTSQDVQLQGVEGGADDYLTKPFNNDLLIAKVNSILKNRNHLHNYFYDHVTLKNNNLEVNAEYKELLEKCVQIVERHLDDEDFSVQVLARELGVSHSFLYKRIKLISGQSANAFIRFLRLRKAAEMFINTGATISEVCYKVGFNDVKYFREQFNKLFGVNPSEYINKYRKVLGEKYKVGKSK